jgi:hypothetical protein
MKKDLIIGGCTNYGINQLKPWVLSVNETMPDADKVMCVGNASPETRSWLLAQGFDIVNMPNTNVPIHVLRFLSIYDYLRKNWEKYRYVVTTDVKDVYFQSSPFKWMTDGLQNLGAYELVAGSEGMKYCDEPWGDDNLMKAYGPYVHEQFKNNTIYNVGVLGGTAEYMKDLVFNIFTNAINRPIPVVDQAVFNVLINTQPYKSKIFLAQNKHAWACQAGTMVDPSKIEAFRPFLLEGEPIFEEGVVKTFEHKEYCIVHQYDRVPEWKKFVQQKYEQEDESQLFVYRTA